MSETFWDRSTSGSDLDLPAFLDSRVTDGLGRLLALGVLVSIGLTRDRGALGLTVFDNGKRRREYFRHADECSDWLDAAVAALSGVGLGTTANGGPVGQKPPRGR